MECVKSNEKMSQFPFHRHAVSPLSPAQDVAIATSTNAAYEMMKQGGQGGGQERGHEYELVNPPGGPPVGEGTYEVPSPPAPQLPAAVSGGGGTEGEGDVVYELIPEQ